MTTELTTTKGNTALDYSSDRVLRTIKNTVAQNATDEELAMFCELCKATGLNPFKKEVWFIKTKGYTNKAGKEIEPRVQIMTGINGFLAVANSHPQFDGMECEVERDDKGQPLRAIAKVYRKDRKFPSVAEALWNEYYKPNPYGNKGVWEQMPSIMLAKCAKSLALREAFPQELNGLYTAEEMPLEYSARQTLSPTEPINEVEATAQRIAPKPDLDVENYVLKNSPNCEFNGMALNEIDRDWFQFLITHPLEATNKLEEPDLTNVREFCRKFIKPKQKTKDEQQEEARQKAVEAQRQRLQQQAQGASK